MYISPFSGSLISVKSFILSRLTSKNIASSLLISALAFFKSLEKEVLEMLVGLSSQLLSSFNVWIPELLSSLTCL